MRFHNRAEQLAALARLTPLENFHRVFGTSPPSPPGCATCIVAGEVVLMTNLAVINAKSIKGEKRVYGTGRNAAFLALYARLPFEKGDRERKPYCTFPISEIPVIVARLQPHCFHLRIDGVDYEPEPLNTIEAVVIHNRKVEPATAPLPNGKDKRKSARLSLMEIRRMALQGKAPALLETLANLCDYFGSVQVLKTLDKRPGISLSDGLIALRKEMQSKPAEDCECDVCQRERLQARLRRPVKPLAIGVMQEAEPAAKARRAARNGKGRAGIVAVELALSLGVILSILLFGVDTAFYSFYRSQCHDAALAGALYGRHNPNDSTGIVAAASPNLWLKADGVSVKSQIIDTGGTNADGSAALRIRVSTTQSGVQWFGFYPFGDTISSKVELPIPPPK